MLINCPECGKQISDKAISCPNCGFPIAKPKDTRARATKYRRLPNGFGSIRKLTGKRRKPYGAYPAITDYKDNGTAVLPKAIGYYETWQKAYDALSEYNKNPYDLSANDLTFADVYKLFYEDKYGEKAKKKLSHQSKNSTQSAFLNFKNIHDKKFKTLKTQDYQYEIDNCPLKHSSLELMVSLAKQMYKFALKNDMVQKDYGQFVRINIKDDDESGVPLTIEELKVLWANSTDKVVQWSLVLIYTGMRISELEIAEIDRENGMINTGRKTDAGKNRDIPVHPLIKDFLYGIDQNSFKAEKARGKIQDKLSELNILYTADGLKHTPHDFRHTFSWLADEIEMDSVTKHLIMGHSLKAFGDVEVSVYGHRNFENLISEMNKIKKYGKTEN